MQTQFDIHEAETHFFRLIEQVEAGGEVVITRAGQPVVRLVRIGEAPKRRVLGRLEGHFRLPDESAPPIPEIDVDQGSDGDSANRPSDRTRLAIEELEAGRGKTFADVDDLMREVDSSLESYAR